MSRRERAQVQLSDINSMNTNPVLVNPVPSAFCSPQGAAAKGLGRGGRPTQIDWNEEEGGRDRPTKDRPRDRKMPLFSPPHLSED